MVSIFSSQVDNYKLQKEEDSEELELQKRSYTKRIAALNLEIETMTIESSSTRAAAAAVSGNDASAADKELISRLQGETEQLTKEKSKLQSELAELEGIMMSSNQEWQARIEDVSTEKSKAIRELKEQSLQEASDKEADWEAARLQMKVSLADKERAITALREEKDELNERLRREENTNTSSDKNSVDKEEYEEQIAALREEASQLKRDKEATGERADKLEETLKSAEEGRVAALGQVKELEDKLSKQEEVIVDLGNSKSAGGGGELITDFVQDLFGRLHFAFVPPDSSSADLDEVLLSPNAVLKKCKKVLKQGASEFAVEPE